jgi:hypothetical protein
MAVCRTQIDGRLDGYPCLGGVAAIVQLRHCVARSRQTVLTDRPPIAL